MEYALDPSSPNTCYEAIYNNQEMKYYYIRHYTTMHLVSVIVETDAFARVYEYFRCLLVALLSL